MNLWEPNWTIHFLKVRGTRIQISGPDIEHIEKSATKELSEYSREMPFGWVRGGRGKIIAHLSSVRSPSFNNVNFPLRQAYSKSWVIRWRKSTKYSTVTLEVFEFPLTSIVPSNVAQPSRWIKEWQSERWPETLTGEFPVTTVYELFKMVRFPEKLSTQGEHERTDTSDDYPTKGIELDFSVDGNGSGKDPSAIWIDRDIALAREDGWQWEKRVIHTW